MKSIILIAFVAALTISQVSGQTPNADPNCAREKLSECSNKLLRLIKEDVPIPSTVEEVQTHCEEIKNATRCSRAWFRTCADESSKQIARLMMGGVTKRFNKNCSPEGMQQIVANRDCLASSRVPLRQCYSNAVKDLFNIKSQDKKNWHSLTCCYGSKAHACVTDAVKSNCRPEQSEVYLKEASQLTDELTETFCPTSLVWGKEQCNTLSAGVPTVDPPAGTTVLPIMLDIMKEVQVDSTDDAAPL